MPREDVSLGVRVNPDLLSRVDEVASDCLLNRSEWVRGVLVEAIKAHALRNKRIAAMLVYRGEPEL